MVVEREKDMGHPNYQTRHAGGIIPNTWDMYTKCRSLPYRTLQIGECDSGVAHANQISQFGSSMKTW